MNQLVKKLIKNLVTARRTIYSSAGQVRFSRMYESNDFSDIFLAGNCSSSGLWREIFLKCCLNHLYRLNFILLKDERNNSLHSKVTHENICSVFFFPSRYPKKRHEVFAFKCCFCRPTTSLWDSSTRLLKWKYFK